MPPGVAAKIQAGAAKVIQPPEVKADYDRYGTVIKRPGIKADRVATVAVEPCGAVRPGYMLDGRRRRQPDGEGAHVSSRVAECRR